MDWQAWLSVASNVAQTLTAITAVGATVFLYSQRRTRRRRLEIYLEKAWRDAEAPRGEGSGAKKISHLVAKCLMTQAQVLEAAFASSKIESWIGVDDEINETDTLLFRFSDGACQKVRKSN
jgi:hypothetical protein